jgi:hypothetical protein
MPELWHRISGISLRRQRVGRVRRAQGDLLPLDFCDYARPDHRFLDKKKQRFLSLGSYQVFSLVNVPPLTLQ